LIDKKELFIKKMASLNLSWKRAINFLPQTQKLFYSWYWEVIHSTKEILPSTNPVTELECSLIELLLLKSTQTNVLQGYTFVNIESELIESTLIFGKEHYRKEKELKTRYCPFYNFRYQFRAKLFLTDTLN